MAEKAKRKRGAPTTTTALGTLWAKRALYEFCFRAASGDPVAATKILRLQLDAWVQHKALFLVRHIYAKTSQLTAARKHCSAALDGYVKWHRTQPSCASPLTGFPDGSCFEQYAARAFIYSIGMRISEKSGVWDLFPELAQAVATEVPLRPADREWNGAEVAASPAAELLNSGSGGGGGGDPELLRCELVAQRRVYSVVASGLPSVAQVRELCDRAAAAQFRERIDELDGSTYCGPSIDDALTAGTQRRWTSAEQVQHRLALFNMICDAYIDGGDGDGLPPAMRIAELYTQYARTRTAASRAASSSRAEAGRAQAAAFGFWRIRRDDHAKWMQALSADEWCAYQAGIAQVPRGVLMYVRRRRFNTDSLANMRAENLALIQAKTQVQAPQDAE